MPEVYGGREEERAEEQTATHNHGTGPHKEKCPRCFGASECQEQVIRLIVRGMDEIEHPLRGDDDPEKEVQYCRGRA